MGRVLLAVRSDIHAALSSTPKDGVLPVWCEMRTDEIEGAHYYCHPCGFFAYTVCAMRWLYQVGRRSAGEVAREDEGRRIVIEGLGGSNMEFPL